MAEYVFVLDLIDESNDFRLGRITVEVLEQFSMGPVFSIGQAERYAPLGFGRENGAKSPPLPPC
jgi:hypothetical protein